MAKTNTMSDFQQILVDMGFDKTKVEYALKVTNNKGVEPAMEWLIAHADENVPTAEGLGNSSTLESTSEAGSNTKPSTEMQAKSLKCEDCGKIFKNTAEMEFHATKTNHSNFSESAEEKPPLTAEERQAQLALIEEKLKQKRLEREERERIESLEREKNRIKSGKDMTEARKKMEELEMKKILEQRKREKAEEKAARDRVRAQIEADKAARKAKDQNRSNNIVTQNDSVSPVSTSDVKSPAKEYTQTRIQIRLLDGSTLTETFNVKEQLSAARVLIQMKTNIDTPFKLMTSFPRKVFSDDEYEKSLEDLGLVPTAVLIVTK